MRLDPTLLKRFSRQVRLVRAWQSGFRGLLIGGLFAAVFATFDTFHIWNFEPVFLAMLVVGGVAVGILIGALWPLQQADLIDSIDRRAALANRLATAHEVRADDGLARAIQADARASLDKVKPSKIFALRWGRVQNGAIAALVTAGSIFLLGNSPIMLSPSERANRAELKVRAETVKRIRKEAFETPEAKKSLTEEEKRLADELRRLQREMEMAKKSPEELLRKQNELSDKAQNLKDKRTEAAREKTETAKTALEKWEKNELDKKGLADVDPKAAQMTTEQREQRRKELEQLRRQNESKSRELEKRINELQKRLDALNKRLEGKNLSKQDRAKLEAEKKALEQQINDLKQQQAASKNELQELQKQMEGLNLSKEAQDSFRQMMNDPTYKKLQEMANKLAKESDRQAQDSQSPPQLSNEELAEMKRQLEELAKQLKDPAAMKEFLEAMRQAIENAQIGQGLGLVPGMRGPGLLPSGPMPGVPSQDFFMGDTGKVNHTEKAEPGQGKTSLTSVSGKRRNTGADSYIEIKAPTTVGNRSSVPYRQVLPSYQKKAEAALNRQEIPKEHQRRVREYFESLGK